MEIPAHMTLRIGFDLDDILLEMIPAFLEFYNEKHGRKYTLPEMTTYSLWEIFGTTREEMLTEFNEFYATPLFKNLPPTPGAKEGVAELSKGNHLIIITNRPLSILDVTIAQAERHFPNRFAALYATNLGSINPGQKTTKAHVCKELGINVFIEDSIESAQPCSQSGTPVILLDHPWNQHPAANGLTRALDWPGIVQGVYHNVHRTYSGSH